jgi:hypothetical protein
VISTRKKTRTWPKMKKKGQAQKIINGYKN